MQDARIDATCIVTYKLTTHCPCIAHAHTHIYTGAVVSEGGSNKLLYNLDRQ